MLRWFLSFVTMLIISTAALAVEKLPGPFEWDKLQDPQAEIIGEEWINTMGAIAVTVRSHGEMFLCAKAEIGLLEVGKSAHCQSFKVVKQGWLRNIPELLPTAELREGIDNLCSILEIVREIRRTSNPWSLFANIYSDKPILRGMDQLDTELKLVYQPKCIP